VIQILGTAVHTRLQRCVTPLHQELFDAIRESRPTLLKYANNIFHANIM